MNLSQSARVGCGQKGRHVFQILCRLYDEMFFLPLEKGDAALSEGVHEEIGEKQTSGAETIHEEPMNKDI